MNTQRNIVNKAATICCQWCNAEISAYALPSHLKGSHKDKSIDDYVAEFGEFRKSKLNATKERTCKTVEAVCEICAGIFSTVGMSNHLRDSHNMTTEQYLSEGYSEFRPKYINYTQRAEENDLKCLICGESTFASHQHFSHHVAKVHKITMMEYAKTHIFNNEIQLCKCGCGNSVKLTPRPPYKLTYINGHN